MRNLNEWNNMKFRSVRSVRSIQRTGLVTIAIRNSGNVLIGRVSDQVNDNSSGQSANYIDVSAATHVRLQFLPRLRRRPIHAPPVIVTFLTKNNFILTSSPGLIGASVVPRLADGGRYNFQFVYFYFEGILQVRKKGGI